MEYLSTDYKNGGTSKCSMLLRQILDSQRTIVIPFHEDNVMPCPTLIIKGRTGKLHLIEVSFVDDTWRQDYAMLLTMLAGGDVYIYKYRQTSARRNVFSALAQPGVHDVSTAPRYPNRYA